VPREESMIRTPLYAALLLALSQPVLAQSPASQAPRAEPVRTSLPATAPAAAPDDCPPRDGRLPAAGDRREAQACLAAIEPLPGTGGGRLPPRRAAGDAAHYFAADGAADGSDDAQATGENAVASGAGSVAGGYRSVASGHQAHAAGQWGIAVGSQSAAAGLGDVAMGAKAQAAGGSSVAIGGAFNTFAGWEYTAATGAQSVAVGAGAKASGDYGAAVGAVASAPAFA